MNHPTNTLKTQEMQISMKTTKEQYGSIDIHEYDLRLQTIDCFTELGMVELTFDYDLTRTWEEWAEGGIVVASGYVYDAENLKIVKATDMEETCYDYMIDPEDEKEILSYIYTRLYDHLNEIAQVRLY